MFHSKKSFPVTKQVWNGEPLKDSEQENDPLFIARRIDQRGRGEGVRKLGGPGKSWCRSELRQCRREGKRGPRGLRTLRWQNSMAG